MIMRNAASVLAYIGLGLGLLVATVILCFFVNYGFDAAMSKLDASCVQLDEDAYACINVIHPAE